MASVPLLRREEVSARFVPVVLGGEIFAYSLARCFYEAYAIKTVVLSAVDVQVTSSSRFVDYRICPEMGQGDEAIVGLLSRIGEKIRQQGKVALVIGSADWHARLLSSHKDELSRWFAVPYNDFELLDEITQKERFYELCEELGIDYPRTWTFSCADPTVTIDAASFTYPVIAKPSNSARYDLMSFPGKEKIYEVHAPEDLVRIFNLLRDAGYDRELVVQDFIPGEDDAIRTLTTFSDATGDVRVVSGGRVVVQDHSPYLIGNPLCILSERTEEIIDAAKRFCKRTGYRGFANFDIKYDERDGRYKFFEVNTRPGRNTYYMALGGVNIGKLLVDEYILGERIPYREAYDRFLYTCVPSKVIRKTVLDEPLRDEVLGMYNAGQASYPYHNASDTLKHKVLARAVYYNQIKKFRRYVWDVREAARSGDA